MGNKRSKEKFKALKKDLNLKIRQELMDQDYIDLLSEDEKDWLNRFNEEYLNTNFKHEGERLHPKETKVRKIKRTGKKKKLDRYKNESETRNNLRNRDSFAITKMNHILYTYDEKLGKKEKLISSNTEDNLIELIDLMDEANKRTQNH